MESVFNCPSNATVSIYSDLYNFLNGCCEVMYYYVVVFVTFVFCILYKRHKCRTAVKAVSVEPVAVVEEVVEVEATSEVVEIRYFSFPRKTQSCPNNK